jgi:hypothetical protein
MKMADAKSVFHERHALVKGPIQKAYDKKFDEAFNAIAHRIEDQALALIETPRAIAHRESWQKRHTKPEGEKRILNCWRPAKSSTSG